jgi:hypothetical protein
MKKKTLGIIIVAVVIITVLAVVAYVVFFPSHKGTKAISIDRLLPEGAYAYVHVNDVEKNVEIIKNTDFWQQIYKMDYDRLYKKKLISAEQAQFIRYFKEKVAPFFDSLIFDKFFSQELALVVYKTNIGFSSQAKIGRAADAQTAEIATTGGFLVTRLPFEGQLAGSSLDLLGQLFKDVSINGVEYKDYTIQIVTFKETKIQLSYVKIQDYLVIGLGDLAARLSVDTFEGLKPSLAEDTGFQDIKKKGLRPASLFCNLKVDFLFSLLKNEMLANMEVFRLSKEARMKALDKVRASFEKVSSFHDLNLSLRIASQGMTQAALQLLYDPNRLDPAIKDFYTCPSEVNQSTVFTPKDVLAYHWGNCIDFSNIWEEFKDEKMPAALSGNQADAKGDAKDQAPASNVVTNLVEQVLLASLGNEVGGYLTDVRKGKLFPVPQAGLFVEITQTDKVQTLLEGLKDSPLFFVRPQEYKNIPYKHIVFPVEMAIEPCYCFLDDYLVVTVDEQILQKTIDAYTDPGRLSLEGHPGFTDKVFAYQEKSRGIQFFETDRLAQKLQSMVDWSREQMDKRKAQQKAFLAGRQQRVQEIKETIEDNQQVVQEARERLDDLRDQEADLTAQGADATVVTEEMKILKKKIDFYEKLITADEKQIKEIRAFMKDQDRPETEADQKDAYWDEVVMPLLKALQTVDMVGTKTRIADGVFELLMFFQ